MMEDLDFAETHIPLKNDMKTDVGRITKELSGFYGKSQPVLWHLV